MCISMCMYMYVQVPEKTRRWHQISRVPGSCESSGELAIKINLDRVWWHAFHPSIQEAEAGRSLKLRVALST